MFNSEISSAAACARMLRNIKTDGTATYNKEGTGSNPNSERSYNPPPNKPVIKQESENACVVACLRMLLAEHHIETGLSERQLGQAIGNDPLRGGGLEHVADYLNAQGVEQKYRFVSDATVETLRDAIKGGRSAIVSIRSSGRLHAIMLDSFNEDDGSANVRDPWPVAYKYNRLKYDNTGFNMSLDEFSRKITGRAVVPVE